MADKVIEGKASKCKLCSHGMMFVENGVIHICCLVRSRGGVCRYSRKGETTNG